MNGSKNINFRAFPEERRKLDTMSKQTGLTPSAVLRLLIRNADVVRVPISGEPLITREGSNGGNELVQSHARAVA